MAGREKASERLRKQDLLCWIRLITLFFGPVGLYTARPLSGLYRKFQKWPRRWQGKSTCFTSVLIAFNEGHDFAVPRKTTLYFRNMTKLRHKILAWNELKGANLHLKRLFPDEIWRLSTRLITKLQFFISPPMWNHRFFRNSFYQIEGFVGYASARRSPQVSFILKKDCLVALI